MAITAGTPLISQSEHGDKVARRPLVQTRFTSTPSFRSTQPNVGAFGSFISNTLFSFVDSALFGIPQNLMRRNMEVVSDSFLKPDRMSYGQNWDRLGIQPFEELGTAGRVGAGLGMAAGFFVPFMGISRGTTALQRMHISNVKNLIGRTSTHAVEGLPSANVLEAAIRGTLLSHRKKIPHVYRTTPEQYKAFSNSIRRSVETELSSMNQAQKFGLNPGQIKAAAQRTTEHLEELGRQRRFVDNFEDWMAVKGITHGDNAVSRGFFGYMGRAIDQSVNMALYEGLGELARQGFNAPYEDYEYNLLESIRNSAGFASLIAMVDFIPGGRRAGVARDFYKVAKMSLARKANFRQMYADGKINDNQLSTLVAWFSNQASVAPRGKTISALQVGRMSPEEKISWLEKTYGAARTTLMKDLMRDTGKSLVGSLPRAFFDGVISAAYMQGPENFMATLTDESMAGSFLVGAFMAMRAHRPLDMRKAMQWRYTNTIDAKLNFMQSMGMRPGAVNDMVRGMDALQLELDFNAKNYESSEVINNIERAVFDGKYSYDDGDGGFSMNYMQEKGLAHSIVTTLIPLHLKKSDKLPSLETLNDSWNDGTVPNVYRMSDSDFMAFWNKIKDIETPVGKKISEYKTRGFDHLREDLEMQIARNHEDILLTSLDEFSTAVGIKKLSNLQKRDGKIVLKDFTVPPDANDNVQWWANRINELRSMDKVVVERTGEPAIVLSDESLGEAGLARVTQISEGYATRSAEHIQPGFRAGTFSNPAFEYLNQYWKLTFRNKITDAINNVDRPEDPQFGKIRAAINDMVGENPSSRGIRINDEGLTDSQKAELARYQKLIDETVDMKWSSGRIDMNSPEKIVDFKSAKAFYDSLDKAGIIHFDEANNLYFGDQRTDALKKKLRDTFLLSQNMTNAQFMEITHLMSKFPSGTGKVLIPDKKLAKDIIKREIADDLELNKRDREAILDDHPQFKEMYDFYINLVDRLSKTDVVEFTNDLTIKRGEERFTDVINTLREVNNAESQGQLKEWFDTQREMYRKSGELIQKAIDIRTRMEDERSVGTIAAERLVEYERETARAISEHQEIITDLRNKNILHPDVEILVRDADLIIGNEASRASGESLTKRLFDQNFLNDIADFHDFSREVARLANTSRASDSHSVAMAQIRDTIMKKMSLTQEQANKLSIHDMIDELVALDGKGNRGVTLNEAKELITTMNRFVNVETGINELVIYNDLSTREVMDVMRESSSERRRLNIQTFIGRLKKLKVEGFLNEKGDGLNKSTLTALQDGTEAAGKVMEIMDALNKRGAEEGMGDYVGEHYQALSRELTSIINNVNSRNREYPAVEIFGSKFSQIQGEKSVMTPIGEFATDMRNIGLEVHMIKDFFNDGNKRQLSRMNLYEAQALLATASTGVNVKATEQAMTNLDKMLNTSNFLASVFVPLQTGSNIGVVFSATPGNVAKLMSRFNSFRARMEDELKSPRYSKHSQAFAEHFGHIVKNFETGNLTFNNIRAAIAAMYYRDYLGKDVFFPMLGEGGSNKAIFDSSKAGQQKIFKYLGHVNSENAVSFDANSLGISKLAVDAIIKKTGVTDLGNISQLLNKRAEKGVRVYAYDNESKDADGNILKRNTVRGLVEESIRADFSRRNLDPELADRLIEDTMTQFGEAVSSLDQALNDGVTFASKDAMTLDAFLMGQSFENGVRAAKVQFHAFRQENSLIGKHATRYDPSLDAFMMEYGIDYIMPATSAKIWSKREVMRDIPDYNPSQRLSQNLERAFPDKRHPGNIRTFAPETVKYMFPGHAFGALGKTNTSVTHFMSAEALADYNKQLAMDHISNVIESHLRLLPLGEEYSGIGDLFLKKYEENQAFYSAISAAEQLIHWGFSIDNSLVRNTVLRSVRNVVHDKLLSQNRKDVMNGFLFSDVELKSPVFTTVGDNSNYNSHVVLYGEARLPRQNLIGLSTDNDMTLVANWTQANNKSTQDFIFNFADGRKQLFSADGRKTTESLNADVVKALEYVWKHAVEQGNYSFALDRTDLMNMRNVNNISSINKELGDAIRILRANGVDEIGIAINPHKIPKKFGSDSVVNRLKQTKRSGNESELGNVIEINNYEIATLHQADQDGDKATVYLKMPFSVMEQSSRNMGIIKEPIIQRPEVSSFPNVFYSLENGDVRPSQRSNPLEYMREQVQSKMVVGSVVKLQGVFTMLDSLGMMFNGKRIMNFNKTDSADQGMEELHNFHKAIGSVTQSILDSWKGVNVNLFNVNTIKDFILFGDPIKGVDIAHRGIFQIPKEYNQGIKREVYKDYVKRIINTFEDVYSSIGDVYEGGVTRKREHFEMQRAYYNLKNLVDLDGRFLYRDLLTHYRRTKQFDKAQELSHIAITNYDTAREGRFKYRNIFSFDKKFDDIVNISPHANALHRIVNEMGDISRYSHEDYQYYKTNLVDNLFSYEDYQGTRLLSMIINDDTQLLPDLYINDDMINSVYKTFGNKNAKPNMMADASRTLGVFNATLSSHVNKLYRSLSFYRKIGDESMAKEIQDQIDVVRAKQKDVFEKVIQASKDGFGEAFVVDKKYGEIINYTNKTKTPQVIYRKTGDGGYDFVGFINPGRGAPKYVKYSQDGYIVLKNPIENVPPDASFAKEGFAAHAATDDYYSIVQNNVRRGQAHDFIEQTHATIAFAKQEVRRLHGETMDRLSDLPSARNEIYDNDAFMSNIVFKSMFKRLSELIDVAAVDFKSGEQLRTAVAKMLISPDAIPGKVMIADNTEVPVFSVNKRFVSSMLKHIVTYKSSDMNIMSENIAEVMQHMSANIRRYNGQRVDGPHESTFSSHQKRLAYLTDGSQDIGLNLYRSILQITNDNMMARMLFDSSLERGRVDISGNIVHKGNKQNLKDNSQRKWCPQ